MSSIFGTLFFIASLVMAKYGVVSIAYIIAAVLCVIQWEAIYGKKDEKGDDEV